MAAMFTTKVLEQIVGRCVFAFFTALAVGWQVCAYAGIYWLMQYHGNVYCFNLNSIAYGGIKNHSTNAFECLLCHFCNDTWDAEVRFSGPCVSPIEWDEWQCNHLV